MKSATRNFSVLRNIAIKATAAQRGEIHFTRARTGRLATLSTPCAASATRSARTADRLAAERAAQAWEEELTSNGATETVSWDLFHLRFRDEHLAGLAEKSAKSYKTALNWFEAIVGKPLALDLITPSVVSGWQSKMLAEHAATYTQNPCENRG